MSYTTPRELPVVKEKYKQDLKNLDKIHLIEMKEREEKLLSNKKRLNLLPDKGIRIKEFYEKILEEIRKRDVIESATKLFSELNIASTGIKKVNQMEWTGGISDNIVEYVDSDDDELENSTNLIKILAQSRNQVKTVRILPPEKSLITEKDLQEIQSFKKDEEETLSYELEKNNVQEEFKNSLENSSNNSNSSISKSNSINLELDGHTLYICDKIIDSFPKCEKFKPYKTTIHNTHDPEKEKSCKILKNVHWENTAATPPPIQHKGTKLITLKDSIDIQFDYINKLKSVQEEHAAERLKRVGKMKIILPDENVIKMNNTFNTYQNKYLQSDSSDNESSSEEEVDDDYEDKAGTITYTINE